MKKLLSIICLCALSLFARSQCTTQYPTVSYSYSSAGMATSVSGVASSDEFIAFSIIISTSNYYQSPWVALSSNTVLTDRSGNVLQRILGWFVDVNGETTPLNLDERYSLNPNTLYTIYLIFPGVSANVNMVDIVERVSNGFAWRGIRFNNSPACRAYSSSSGNGIFGGHSGGLDDRSSSGSSGSYGRGGGIDGWSGSGSSSSGGSSYPSSGYGSSTTGSDFEPTGSGTCFAISTNGYMATCYHVVENAYKLRVRGVNGDFSKTYSAKVVMSDRGNDLAIIKIDDPSFRSLPALPYSISPRQADVGDNVFVVGYPLRAVMGDELKLTNGIVSSRTGFQGDATSYQLSATVQPGNSGGPLFNSAGAVVGVVNARLQVESATYAVKSPYLRTLIESMDTPISIPQSSTIATLSLSEQVRKIRNYVYILEIQ